MVEQVAAGSATFLQDEEEFNVASQWRLMWWRFRLHKPALVSVVVVIFFYLTMPVAEFLGMGEPGLVDEQFHYLRPQPIRFFDDGSFSPHVNGLRGYRDEAFKKEYELLPDVKIPIGFFVQAWDWEFLKVVKSNRHLIGFTSQEQVKERAAPFVLGTDNLGRDQWSRVMLATRISLSVGLVGVGLSLIGGVFLGGISGYYGGVADTAIQRVIEIMGAIPALPLWMGLSAAVPQDWSVLQVYFAITIILSIFAWTGMARTVRGKFLALREEDYVTAARLSGTTEARIMFRHMLPSFYSHIIATISLSIPGMIAGEVGLSFLGLGLRPPAVSYGILLQQAQNPQTVALYPWLMFVALPVIVVVFCFNFLGDGLRDAADPYGKMSG